MGAHKQVKPGDQRHMGKQHGEQEGVGSPPLRLMIQELESLQLGQKFIFIGSLKVQKNKVKLILFADDMDVNWKIQD